ncbi:MAG TPA: aminomethyl-transferring glycine dehydrogenase subunit GcvPA [Anaerolineae bacterium]|nr:aminomethyl-transferring glycine dehydrogenase subunit GcvPA [Anaerolineae bacterium]
MHRYIPITDADRAEMLKTIGVESVDNLFDDVPEDAQYPELNLPAALSEMDMLRTLRGMAARDANASEYAYFLGAGAYNHFIPATVPHLIFRAEFFTSYTPYQPEISQGTLQTIFEYQSMICDLTGMDVANASHYDAATAAAEAAVMAINSVKSGNKIIVAPSVHPHYRATMRTYLEGQHIPIVGDEDLSATLDAVLDKHLDNQTAGVLIANPDFLGNIRDLHAIAERVHAAGALLIISTYPIALGMYQAPGDYGADIVIGEGQSLGNALGFGGPYLGIFACKEKYVRRMAGRLVGQTVDKQGRRGFVLTLQAREQHIRREKATSNICTNEALNALAACVYMATMGKQGLRQVAELCYQKAHYTARAIGKLYGYRVLTDSFFNEFVVECPKSVKEINRALYQRKIIGGYDLKEEYPYLKNAMLVAVTEMNSREQIDQFIQALSEVGQ